MEIPMGETRTLGRKIDETMDELLSVIDSVDPTESSASQQLVEYSKEMLPIKVENVANLIDDWSEALQFRKERLKEDREDLKMQETKLEKIKSYFAWSCYKWGYNAANKLMGKYRSMWCTPTEAIRDDIPLEDLPEECKFYKIVFTGDEWQKVKRSIGFIPKITKLEIEYSKTLVKEHIQFLEDKEKYVQRNLHLKMGKKYGNKKEQKKDDANN